MPHDDPFRSAPVGPGSGAAGDLLARPRLCQRAVPSEVARRLARSVRWPGASDVEDRSWRLVAHTADFDAWLIAWPVGGTVELHDHGESRGAVSVISGTLMEAVPRRDGGGPLALVRNELHAGTTLGFGAGHVHDVTNQSDGPALSLHVYSPALTYMTFFDVVGDALVARELHWAHDGSEDHGAGTGPASGDARELDTRDVVAR